jgi:hypothetical protein
VHPRELGERSELLNGEAALVLEPEISAVLELRPFSAFGTPDLVDGIVDELDGVEWSALDLAGPMESTITLSSASSEAALEVTRLDHGVFIGESAETALDLAFKDHNIDGGRLAELSALIGKVQGI